MNTKAIQALARAVIESEAAAISALAERIDAQFIAACEAMLACKGRIVVIGMGKSGHVGSKIAATLASTGTPAFFVHPAEAGHGDMGMIKAEDVVLLLSNSGETDELNAILPPLKRLGVPLVAMTGNPTSTLARHAHMHIDVSVAKEACPLGLAPTSSTTATMVMGDALAVALLETRGFTKEDFARSHPAGALGRRLLLHIRDIMHKGDEVPQVNEAANLSETIVEVTRKRLGMCAITNNQQQVIGVFTDGDLRRALNSAIDPHTTPISKVMTKGGKNISPDALAIEAVQMMQEYRIQGLLVVDAEGKLQGALNFQDLLTAGVV
ncbi:MAG: KpsF/GutQ family sugar-phosphate isomerase [Xanthomonadales bacterium]|nr:KpsF/GutQ family sugar-phosphate isomerase [Xanthomonadales bacterium]